MQLPKVSIVTITYNHEKFIVEALHGFLMQNYNGPIEIIIANDNSPDNTDQVVKTFLKENTIPSNFEIKYTKHEVNKGMMPNFVWALKQATGKYIALCDGDDYWTDPLKLQKQVNFLEENKEIAFVFHNCEIVKHMDLKCEATGLPLTKFIESREYSSNEIFEEWLVPTASVIFRKKLLTNTYYSLSVNKNFIYGDIVLFLYLSTKGRIIGSKDTMSAYRITGKGMTASSSNNVVKRIIHLKEIFKIFGKQFKTQKLKTYLSLYYFNLSKNKSGFSIIKRLSFLIKSIYYDYKLVINKTKKIIINRL